MLTNCTRLFSGDCADIGSKLKPDGPCSRDLRERIRSACMVDVDLNSALMGERFETALRLPQSCRQPSYIAGSGGGVFGISRSDLSDGKTLKVHVTTS